MKVMQMKKHGFLMILATMALAACQVPPTNPVTTPPITTTLTPKRTQPVPTASATTRPSPVPPTATISPSPTVSFTPTPEQVIIQCLEIGPGASLEAVASGGTVFISPIDSPRYLLDLQTGERYNLPLSDPSAFPLRGIEVSPSRNYLAYVERDDNEIQDTLWVITANGQVLASRNFDPGWYWWHWLDDERLEIYWGDAPIAGTVIILNPFTGQQKIIEPGFPDLYDDIFSPSGWMVKYSPDLGQVLYLSNSDQYLGEVVLWDTVMGSALWQYAEQGPETINQVPAWSPSGDQVAAVVGDSLYRVDRNGQVIPIPEAGLYVDKFTWSPNEHYIAFWAHENELYYEFQRLFLLNTETNQLIDYCIKADIPPRAAMPLWSSNSQQLFLHYGMEETGGSLKDMYVLINVNLYTAFEVQILEDVGSPIAWMNSTP